jgi:hypothetical protein
VGWNGIPYEKNHTAVIDKPSGYTRLAVYHVLAIGICQIGWFLISRFLPALGFGHALKGAFSSISEKATQ